MLIEAAAFTRYAMLLQLLLILRWRCFRRYALLLYAAIDAADAIMSFSLRREGCLLRY